MVICLETHKTGIPATMPVGSKGFDLKQGYRAQSRTKDSIRVAASPSWTTGHSAKINK